MGNRDFVELQLHYFFKEEDSHSMNAMIFNECEKCFIQSIGVLNKYLDFTIEVEVLAREEGGIKSLYKIAIENPIILIILTALITRFFEGQLHPAIHPSEETRNKIETIAQIKGLINNGELTEEMFDYVIENDRKLKKLKSEFFKAAKKEQQIERIEIADNNPINNIPLFDKKEIEYAEFDQCILKEEQEKEEVEIDAKIYIVAPILIKGRKDFWKGIYDGESIDFKVTDRDFLEQVHAHTIKFSNGTFINCKMRVVQTIDLNDEKTKIHREVFDVINYGEDESINQIVKRRRGVRQVEYPSLFTENDF